LVLGLIITIEKPISVGDMLEIGTDEGWVKGIGIHSSMLGLKMPLKNLSKRPEDLAGVLVALQYPQI
jgi:small-conductance mechanosensitive channel